MASTLALALLIGVATMVAPVNVQSPAQPPTAQIIGRRYVGPGIRVYRAADQTITYDLDYGTGWHPGGNLGGSDLQPRDHLTVLFADTYLYVFITAETNGKSYWKRADPDAGIDRWTADWQQWTP